MNRPLIAIPARFSTTASALRHRAEVGSRNLLSAVFAAGGDPVLVHPSAPGAVVEDTEVADRVSWAAGILLPGGGDLSSRWSGQAPHPSLYDVDEEQDAFDLALARVALERGIPLLAICRGMQVVNVALGGTLVLDMDSEPVGAARNHRNHRHHISVQAGSQLASVVGERLDVSCYHHQCVAIPGAGLRVTARSEEGVIEALELEQSRGWFQGIQWHPEDTWESDSRQLSVVAALVSASRSSTVDTI
ncbi:gamma-glutamyl-gamma-aminobutyrate hydrolase family protein [Nocardioides sp.]|uniref:gamma-glutamyl-gamma-aminobutyrate hydrolase family protein n=1 Tax=Nocardioides sp. TaxID=35761 RepID=UPI003D0B5759